VLVRGLVLVALLAATGCAARPAAPGADELTGVVTSSNDSGFLPLGGGVSKYGVAAVVLMRPPDFAGLYTEAVPQDRAALDDPAMAATRGWTMPASRVVDGTDLDAGPVLVPVVEGRFRSHWEGGPTVLCVADSVSAEVVLRGCRRLTRSGPPLGVVIGLGFGAAGFREVL
jgi:hypothetical protein